MILEIVNFICDLCASVPSWGWDIIVLIIIIVVFGASDIDMSADIFEDIKRDRYLNSSAGKTEEHLRKISEELRHQRGNMIDRHKREYF